MRKTSKIVTGLAVLGFAALPIAPAFAATNVDTTTVEVTVGETVTIDAGADSTVSFTLDPTSAAYISGTPVTGPAETIVGSSNAGNAWTISAKTSTSDGTLSDDGTTAGGPFASVVNAALSNQNGWSVNYSAFTGTAVSASATGSLSSTPKNIATRPAGTGSGGFTATYATMANNTVPADTYWTTVTYTISD